MMKSGAWEEYGRLLNCRDAGSVREGESASHAGREPEILWQSRFYAGEFGQDFHTTGFPSHAVKIKDFGDWNHGAGPDFQRCLVEIEGEERFGDIELDMDARDWDRHGHVVSGDFCRVVLQVCARDAGSEGGTEWFTRTSENRFVPRVILPSLTHSQAAPGGRPVSRPGLCSTPLASMAAEDVDSLLQAAARHRLERKTRRLRAWIEARGKNQALWQGMAEALGYRGNELAMRILAQIHPIADFTGQREHAGYVEANLFGTAGFLEKPAFDDLPADTKPYARSLWEVWWKRRASRPDLPSIPWSRRPGRPANHPQRRTGALATLARNWASLFQKVAKGPGGLREVSGWLSGLTHDFWSHHFTLVSGALERETSLIGPGRANDLVVNVCFPFLAASSGVETVWAAYLNWPSLQDNDALKRARTRVFGARTDISALSRGAWRQQGLLQLYADFCMTDQSGCRDCLFPEQLAQWRSGRVDKG